MRPGAALAQVLQEAERAWRTAISDPHNAGLACNIYRSVVHMTRLRRGARHVRRRAAALNAMKCENRINEQGHTMRLLSKKELRAIVLYSPAHIDRLEKSGLFPKRVLLGPCRVGWVESEVMEWLEQRIKLRNDREVASSGRCDK
jgi:prophage regulatory protein